MPEIVPLIPINRTRYMEIMNVAQEVVKLVNDRLTAANEVALVLDMVEDILNNPK